MISLIKVFLLPKVRLQGITSRMFTKKSVEIIPQLNVSTQLGLLSGFDSNSAGSEREFNNELFTLSSLDQIEDFEMRNLKYHCLDWHVLCVFSHNNL